MWATQALILCCSVVVSVVCSKNFTCYWNSICMYNLFGTVTPYASVRGDFRDQLEDGDCEVVSMWSLHRHGNRSPSAQHTRDMALLQRRITDLLHGPARAAYYAHVCEQDIEDLVNWSWNSTLDDSANYLTGVGYEEISALARRIARRYGKFLKSVDKVHFRATNEQRTIISLRAYVEVISRFLPQIPIIIDPPMDRDDVLRPYENCKLYEDKVKNGKLLAEEVAAYDTSPEFLAIREMIQPKLPVNYPLNFTEVFTLYQLCRFDRSWSVRLLSPWCSWFHILHLMVLEYRDDVRHYYRNGYGSKINLKLGGLPLRDLYETFVNARQVQEKSLVSYFTHDTMLGMVYSALGLYRDAEPLRGAKRNENRAWRTSEMAAFASNFMAVLYRCNENGEPTHKVRLFMNEKQTPLCPEEGCTWQQFLDIFQVFRDANLEFCADETLESGTAAFLAGRSYKFEMATSLFLLISIVAILQ